MIYADATHTTHTTLIAHNTTGIPSISKNQAPQMQHATHTLCLAYTTYTARKPQNTHIPHTAHAILLTRMTHAHTRLHIDRA